MRKYLVGMFLFALAYAAGRLSSGVRAEAAEVRSPIAHSPSCADLNADGSVDVRDAVYLLRSLFARGPLPVCPESGFNSLPATGQTNVGPLDFENGFQPCELINPTQPGQDGWWSAGCPAEGRFIDNGDETITDTCTQLMWWSLEGKTRWTAAHQAADASTVAGYDDWRIPNVFEMFTILNLQGPPAADGLYLYPIFQPQPVSSIWPDAYLTSTSSPDDLLKTFIVHFQDGASVVETAGKTTAWRIRFVRGGVTQPCGGN